MKRTTISLMLLLSVSSLLLVGIASMGLLSPASYSAEDNGKNVSVNIGDTFWVKLPENPTTGYTWDISVSDGLTKLSDKYEPADRSGMKVGVGGTHSWEIKATKNGTQMVRGTYAKPGNQSTDTVETYTLNVDVVQGGLLSGIFRLPAMLDTGAPGKTTPLSETFRTLIQPGDDIHMSAMPQSLDFSGFPIMQTRTSTSPVTANRNPVGSRDIPISYTDVPPADTISANTGDQIRLTLPENPSTGYSWQMTWSDGLEKVNDNYVQGNTGTGERPLVGSPGTHEWVFKVKQAGTQKVTGVYKRPWEGSSAGEKTYTLNVDAS